MIRSLFRYLQGERAGAGSVLQLAAKSRSVPITPATAGVAIEHQVHIADVSFWQGNIDFVKMAGGLQGVIIRAGQKNWTDSRFLENWREAKAAGLPRGSYWFYDSRETPQAQAALWWSLIDDDDGELIHAADLEENYGGPYYRPTHFREFLDEFGRLSGLPAERIAIYTGYYWWLARGANDPYFARYPLWLAWYGDAPRVPAPWTDMLFWQYTSSGDGPVYGVSSQEIDLNWYCCSLAEYQEEFNLPPTPPPTGEPMPIYKKCAATDGLNIRQGPGTSYADLGDLVLGDHVIGSEEVGGWFHLTHAFRGGWEGDPVRLTDGQTVEARAAATNDVWAKASYLVTVAPPPVEPEPPEPGAYADVPYTYIITLGGGDSPYEVQTLTGAGLLKVKQ